MSDAGVQVPGSFIPATTEAQAHAWLELQTARTPETFWPALSAFRATVEGSGNTPLEALCVALDFIAKVAGGSGALFFFRREARKLLGWTADAGI